MLLIGAHVKTSKSTNNCFMDWERDIYREREGKITDNLPGKLEWIDGAFVRNGEKTKFIKS